MTEGRRGRGEGEEGGHRDADFEPLLLSLSLFGRTSFRRHHALGGDALAAQVTIVVIGIVEPHAVDLGNGGQSSAPSRSPANRSLNCGSSHGFEHQVRLPAVPPQERHRPVQASLLMSAQPRVERPA